MGHIKIKIECDGDAVSALSQTRTICQSINSEFLSLSFKEGFSISVHKDSNMQDLREIYDLKINALKKEK